MHPRVRAIDDVDVAAVVDFDVVRLYRDLAALAALGLQERGFCADLDRLCRGAHLQFDVNTGGDRNLHGDIGSLRLAETGVRYGKLIDAYGERGQRVVPGGGGHGLGAVAGFGVGQHDLGSWNQRAGGIGDGAGNCSAIALPEGARGDA